MRRGGKEWSQGCTDGAVAAMKLLVELYKSAVFEMNWKMTYMLRCADKLMKMFPQRACALLIYVFFQFFKRLFCCTLNSQGDRIAAVHLLIQQEEFHVYPGIGGLMKR